MSVKVLNSENILKNQLLYLFIQNTEYDCFKNQEFNFSPYFNIKYNVSSKTISLEELNNINIFEKLDNIANITAVVGRNGAGKTTLLKFLLSLSRITRPRLEYANEIIKNTTVGFIAVYYIDGKFSIKNYLINEIKCSGFEKDIFICPSVLKNSLDADFRDFTTVYMSMEDRSKNSFKFKSKNFIPLTPRQILQNEKAYFEKMSLEFYDKILNYKYFNFETVLLLDYWSNHCSKVDQNRPINIELLIFEDLYYSKNNNYEFLDSGLRENKNRIYGNYSFYSILVSNLVKELINSGITFPENFISENFDVNTSFSELKTILSRFMNNLKMVCQNNEILFYASKAIEEIIVFSESINNAYEYEYKIVEDVLKKPIFQLKLLDLKKLFNIINNEERSFILKYLNFDFDCSDGEFAKIRAGAYLYYISHQTQYNKRLEIPTNNVILLLDEIDVHLHPAAQRELLNDVIESISSNFINKFVQVIVTSHSPVVLSDLPSGNIIYLDKNKFGKRIAYKKYEAKTFGANIFDLYNDSFFFDDEVLMGAFAKKYIDNLYKIILSKQYNKNEIKMKIELIGEKLIRNQLLHLIDEEVSHNEIGENFEMEIFEKLSDILNILESKKNVEN